MSLPTPVVLTTIERSYRHWLGRSLPTPADLPTEHALAWWHEQAPYSLLAHGTESDPLFCYANRQALRCFDYAPEHFIGMPSRLSASAKDRAARQVLMEQVGRQGYATGYEGWRVDRLGNAFMIHAGVVWNLRDDRGQRCGQAALFWPDPERVGQVD